MQSRIWLIFDMVMQGALIILSYQLKLFGFLACIAGALLVLQICTQIRADNLAKVLKEVDACFDEPDDCDLGDHSNWEDA